MKKALFTILFSFAAFITYAQEKFDNIIFTNGVEYSGRVTSVAGDSISFVHKNETLPYRFAKSKIFRIEFGSGRTELFTTIESENGKDKVVQPVVMPIQNEAAIAKKKSIAILPFRYISRGFNPEMPYTIQREYFRQAVTNGSNYIYQDPSITNGILLRKGIDPQQLRGYSADELCNILGVSYLVMGQVNVVTTGYTSTSTGSTRPTTVFGKPVTVNTTTTSTKENFSTTVTLNIYNTTGGLMYNRTKQSVWNTPDAYKITIDYLLKRSPVQ
jgi:hypothetical protein